MIFNILVLLLGAIAGGILVLSALIYLFQHKLIYRPSTYRPTYRSSLPPETRELEFRTGGGRQVAFYIPASRRLPGSDGALPGRLWILFGGKGSVALNWLGWVRETPDPDAAFLLVDYPGYGCCEGAPSPKGMLENAEGAFRTLAAELGTSSPQLEERMSLLGHSLGAAAALQFAARHPVERVVLVAPFTSMDDMARRTVGRPLAYLLRHSFDNRARLQELADRPHPPRVVLIHGDRDQVIPVEMGRALATAFPEMVEYRELRGADHINVLDAVGEQLAPAGER